MPIEPPFAPHEMESLAHELSLPHFDLMLVGDGSGTSEGKACGWACVGYERGPGKVWAEYGGYSSGTNNIAELEAHLLPVWSWRRALWRDFRENGGKPGRSVVVVSDSELTVKCGRGEYGRAANGPLWASVEWFEGKGYSLSWRHVRRNSNPVHAWTDDVAGRVRKAIGALE